MTDKTSDRFCTWIAAAFTAAFLVGIASGPALAQSSVKILVNDEPITSYDIQVRTRMVKVFSQGKQGESTATDQLIDERLKMQEAKARGYVVSDAEVDQEFASRASQLKLQPAQFIQAMKQAGISVPDFKSFLRANMSWAELVRARFRAQVKVTDQDLVAALGKGGGSAADNIGPGTAQEYLLQQIVFVVPKGAGQSAENTAKSRANAYRGTYPGCEAALQAAGGKTGMVVKPPVRRDESQLQGKTAELLGSMSVGQTTPPERIEEGYQLLGICAKTTISDMASSNEDLRSELANERGQLLARRYLRDLRADAVIEYR